MRGLTTTKTEVKMYGSAARVKLSHVGIEPLTMGIGARIPNRYAKCAWWSWTLLFIYTIVLFGGKFGGVAAPPPPHTPGGGGGG